MEYFKYLSSVITNDAKCAGEIKSRNVKAKEAFIRKKTLFTSKLYLNLWKQLVKCYIWSLALSHAETGDILESISETPVKF
jgi:hypothetical protein